MKKNSQFQKVLYTVSHLQINMPMHFQYMCIVVLTSSLLTGMMTVNMRAWGNRKL